MKKNFTLALIGIALVCNASFAQTPPAKKQSPTSKPAAPAQGDAKHKYGEPPPGQQPTAAMDEGMQAWMAYMTPGAMHQMLASCNGEWKENITFWMTPGAPPTQNVATCTNTMIMGDRYQESRHSSVMNGMPFEGRGIVGYDNARKIFVTTWIDNMGTGIMYLEGPWDEANKSIHFIGKSVDPMTGAEMMVREEFKIIDEKTQRMEMYMTQNGTEYKSMEIKFAKEK